MTFYKAAFDDIGKFLFAKNPCVCITTAFITGIIIHRFYPITAWTSHNLLYLLGMYSLAAIIIPNVLKKTCLPLLFLWFIFAGYCTATFHERAHNAIPSETILTAKITSNLEEKVKTYKTKVSIEHTSGVCNAIVYIQKDSTSVCLRYGDIIIIPNSLQTIENQPNSNFDYKNYLANQYIYTQTYIRTNQWEKIGHEEDIFSFCASIRNKALQKLDDLGLEESNLHLIAALAFGDKTLLDDETKNEFQTAGAMHILAVSGLHVGIINSILFFLFGFIRKREYQWIKIICCVLGIWLYACLTGMSPSVQRASIMCSIISVSIILKRNSSTYNSLAVAAFISLLLSPNDLFSVSFQLSYLAVLSIVYFCKYIQNIVQPETTIGEYLWGIIAVSISVQLGTTPITLYYFGAIPTYSLITNIVVIPLSFILLISTIIALATAWLPALPHIATQLLNFATSYMRDAISDINTFPHPQLLIQTSLQQSLLSYTIICLLIMFIELWQIRKRNTIVQFRDK